MSRAERGARARDRRSTMRKRTKGLAAIGFTALAAGAVLGIPTQSRVTNDDLLDGFGVPEGAEVIATQFDAAGNYLTVVYKDSSGKKHTIGGVERRETPGPTEYVEQYRATSRNLGTTIDHSTMPPFAPTLRRGRLMQLLSTDRRGRQSVHPIGRPPPGSISTGQLIAFTAGWSHPLSRHLLGPVPALALSGSSRLPDIVP